MALTMLIRVVGADRLGADVADARSLQDLTDRAAGVRPVPLPARASAAHAGAVHADDLVRDGRVLQRTP